MIEVEKLLAPVSDDVPAGPDLAYDPEFVALEAAAQGKAEQQYGDTVIPAEEPDWRDVRLRSEALLSRTKDLRVAIPLARAWTKLDQVEGLSAGLELITGMLSRFWDCVHPELDHEDSDDPMMRMNALAPLADSTTFLRDVRGALLVNSAQHGRVAVRDILVASGKLAASGGPSLSETEINGIVRAVSAENPQPLQAVLGAVQTVGTLESFLREKDVLTQAPDLRPLADTLSAVASVCSAALGRRQDSQTAAGTATSGAAVAVAHAPGQIASRDDAIRVLDSVCRFIEQSEPSNPAPLLIRRAQRLMSLNFVEIIQDLAPESLDQIQKLAGLEQK